MPNANYLSGRRFEYERMDYYRQLGQTVMRTAGSHGPYDLIALDSRRAIVTLVQCKVVTNVSAAKRLIQKFRLQPPLPPMTNIHQTLEVKVKGSKEVLSVTV